jgi:hypothetical protein
MNVDQKLTAIRDVIQQDIGNRGLARDPKDNLLTATRNDFALACHEIAELKKPHIDVVTGFWIPTSNPPAFETDGPLGALHLARAFRRCRIPTWLLTDPGCWTSLEAGLSAGKIPAKWIVRNKGVDGAFAGAKIVAPGSPPGWPTHTIALERVGPASDGRCHTMRGHDVTDNMLGAHAIFVPNPDGSRPWRTIGIGDGGNEIGMGKIPHETIVKNIPNGDLIHCRVPTDHLIVAGVSNWGAYALGAGVALLRGVELPAELFDPGREREILQVMVEKGPLVDGVTGKQTATVDGLSWEDYIRPLVEIGRIVRD